jgi:hypothetical protein
MINYDCKFFCKTRLGRWSLHSFLWTELIRKLVKAGNTKGGSITVPLISCLTGLDQPVLPIKTKFVSCHTADSKPVQPEVNGTVILPPLVFPGHGQ